MSWTQRLQSRVLSFWVSAALLIPLGAPSVLAYPTTTDELRPPASRASGANADIAADPEWASGHRVWDSLSVADREILSGLNGRIMRQMGLAPRENTERGVQEVLARAFLGQFENSGVATDELVSAAQAYGAPGIDRELARAIIFSAIRPTAMVGSARGESVNLSAVALAMVPANGGILAADESAGTAGRRLASVGLENTEKNREAMRRMLLTTPGLAQAGISTVILDRDTIRNRNTVSDTDPTLLADYLLAQGIKPILKTDEGLVDDPNHPDVPGVKLAKDPNLEQLAAILEEGLAAGVVGTKFRTTVPVNAPEGNMRANAQVQAAQAVQTQAAGLVPVVEPEVVYDGSDGSTGVHSLRESYATTTRMLEMTFEELASAGATPEGLILKTSMILAGKNADAQTDPETVGFETLKGLLKTVPSAVPAIVFLSGGQSDDQATENLAAITDIRQNRFAEVRDAVVAELRSEGNTARADEIAALTQAPWEVSYSYGRGLQARALAAWGGQADQVETAQATMHATAREVQLARTVGQLPSIEVARAQALEDVRMKMRVPSENLPHHGKAHTTAIAAAISDPDQGFRGRGREFKSDADTRGTEISDAYTIDQGRSSVTYAFEGEMDVALGDLVVEDDADAFHEAGAIVNRNALGEEDPAVDDVVEGTGMTATNNNGVPWEELSLKESGGTSIRATGPGIRSLGVTPELYVLAITTTVPVERRAEVQAKLDPAVADETNPYEGMKATLGMLAEANGLGIEDLEVVIIDREREMARLAALDRLEKEFDGLVVTRIGDGTVAPGVVGTLGAKEGKHVVMWSTSKSAEAYYNTIVAKIMQQSAGAVSAVRPASFENLADDGSGKKPTDLARWNQFSESEQKKIRNANPDKAGAILAGTLILSPDDVQGPVEASMSMITDNGWFGLRGARESAVGVERITTLRFSDPNGDGNGFSWVDVDDVRIADVERVLARSKWVEQEPAAADAAVVDNENHLLDMMRDAANPRTIAVHPDVAKSTPGFFIAWERVLERFMKEEGLASMKEAAQKSAVTIELAVENQKRTALVFGGAPKFADKIGFLESIVGSTLDTGDAIFVGSAPAEAFIQAQKEDANLADETIAAARTIQDLAKARGIEVVLPQDMIERRNSAGEIYNSDIGEASRQAWRARLTEFDTLLWNGTPGESDKFKESEGGSLAVVEAANIILAKGGEVYTVGGDTAAAARQFGINESAEGANLSTAGGAALTAIAGEDLPGIQALSRGEPGSIEEGLLAGVETLDALESEDLTGKLVYVRVDYNVPVNDAGEITDDARIRETLDTLEFLSSKGARVALVGHFGRPSRDIDSLMRKEEITREEATDRVHEDLSFQRVRDRLAELVVQQDWGFGVTVRFANNAVALIGSDAANTLDEMEPGDITMMENLRFHDGEQSKESGERDAFARNLYRGADFVVNDSAGQWHNEDASTANVPAEKRYVAGRLVQKEAALLQPVVDQPVIRQAEAEKAAAEFVEAINEQTNGATRLEPEFVGVTTTKPTESVAAAIGPAKWLEETVADAADVKVAFNAPEADTEARSGAAALYAAVEAVEAGGELPAAVAARLDIDIFEGLPSPIAFAVTEEMAVDVKAYRDRITSL